MKEEIINEKVKSMKFNLTMREYKIAKATLDNAIEKILAVKPCCGCMMADTCRRYGQPESCLRTGVIDELKRITSELEVVNPYFDE